MNTTARYVLVIFSVIISLHYILSLTHADYGRATSWSRISLWHTSAAREKNSQIPEEYFLPVGAENATTRRANAAFIILARNSDINGIIQSVRQMEERFNRKYNYPYIILNEEPFTDDFKRRLSVLSVAPMEFGQIPREHWYQPDWIDEDKAANSRNNMVANKVIYGGSVSYRNMCRFNSGFFFRHPLLDKYRWYWRIEPDVQFHCDVSYDPFLYMEDHGKVYGFTITMYEFDKTIPTLWNHVKEFMQKHPEYIAENNALNYMSDDNGKTYNNCHFWSNFEIADLDFWRGEAYTKFFDYLDSTGGFYYERWGDAPVHSIAAALFARKDQIHFFENMGYEHNPYVHCPRKEADWTKGRCSCDQKRNFDYDGYSCMRQWDRIQE